MCCILYVITFLEDKATRKQRKKNVWKENDKNERMNYGREGEERENLRVKMKKKWEGKKDINNG